MSVVRRRSARATRRAAAAERSRDRAELKAANDALAEFVGELRRAGQRLDGKNARLLNVVRMAVVALIALDARDERSRRVLRFASELDEVSRRIVQDTRKLER